MSYGAILFDVDGTLLDTTEFIFSAYEHTLAELGLPVPGRAELTVLVGAPLEHNYQSLAGEGAERAIELHRAFQSERVDMAPAFPGVAPVLEAIRGTGLPVGAVTSRSKRTSVRTLEAAGIAHLLDAVVSAEDAPSLKPHPAPHRVAHELLGAPAGPVVMVGDAHQDIEAGRAFSATTVGATYGFHGDKLRDAAPDYLIDAIADLLEVLRIRA